MVHALWPIATAKALISTRVPERCPQVRVARASQVRRCGGGLTLEHLHAGLCIAAKYQAALLIGRDRLGVQLAHRVRFGIKVRLGSMPPVRPLVGLQSHVWQETPETGAADARRCAERQATLPQSHQGPAVTGRSWSVGRALATAMPCTRGEEARRRVRPSVGPLASLRSPGEVALSPRANGVVATAQSAADVQSGRGVGIRRSQDDARA